MASKKHDLLRKNLSVEVTSFSKTCLRQFCFDVQSWCFEELGSIVPLPCLGRGAHSRAIDNTFSQTDNRFSKSDDNIIYIISLPRTQG